MACMSKIIAVVVAYRPNLEKLHEQFAALLPQVHSIVVVDNSPGAEVLDWAGKWPACQVHCIALGQNMGIAHAQNRGIEWARSMGGSHVLLMDHDSIPAQNMVAQLLRALEAWPHAGAVGPHYTDARRGKNKSPFVRTVGLRRIWLNCFDGGEAVEVDHLIASGCLIPMGVLDHVGAMREDFFIDFVDVEWCLRARHAGYRMYGVCAAPLEHQLGDKPVRFLGREYLSHSPLRHYFHARNAMLLYREPWVPLNWKLVSAWRLLLKMGFHVLVTAPRLRHLEKITRGLLHGLMGRAGGIAER